MTFRITFVNMPFASVNRPSFALSQLAALTRREFPDRVEVRVVYPNQDFADRIGLADYESIATDIDHLLTGVGDWLFRPLAFPESDDNSAQYFTRFYRGPRWTEFRDRIAAQRAGLERFCLDVIERHDLASADLVGFTSMFTQTLPSVAMARLLKRANPAVRTAMGGANCEAPMGSVIAETVDDVDFVFSGPALHSFPELVGRLLDGDPDPARAITGVLSAPNRHDPRARRAIGRERDIDDVVEPDYRDFVSSYTAFQDWHPGAGRPVLYFETSRGCWWGERSHCTFCGLNGQTMNFRAMAPEHALTQFERLFRFVPWCRDFYCTDNILPRSYSAQVLEKLAPPAGATIFYEVKLPLSHREMRALSNARVTEVQPGIEALSTRTLALMGKGTTAFQNLQFLKNCLRYDIEPQWNLLIGFPGEDAETYRKYAEDLPLLTHLPPPTGVFPVRFDRFSPYHADPDKYGLRLRPVDSYGLAYPFDDGQLSRLAYFFTDDNNGDYAVDTAEWYTPLTGLVRDWRERWAGRGPADRPALSLDTDPAGQASIVDTRGDTVRRSPIGAAETALLRRLVSPARSDRIDRLAGETGLEPGHAAAALARLRELAVLFEEGDRVLSLVADGTEPDPDPETDPDAVSELKSVSEVKSASALIPVSALKPVLELKPVPEREPAPRLLSLLGGLGPGAADRDRQGGVAP